VTTYCGSCGKECSFKTVDNGIGGYEFWGQRGVHCDYALETSCCGEVPFLDTSLTLEYTYYDYDNDRRGA
jgi:hypothetical protein